MPGDIRTAAWVGAAVFTGAMLRCWNIDQSFWWDEIWSTMPYVKATSLWLVVSSLGYYFNNHILYSLLARGFVSVFGENELAVRLPALLMGLLGIAALFQLGKACLGRECGVLGAFLLSLSAFHIDHASEARGYAGLALFSLLSSFWFLEGLKSHRRRAWVFYVLSTVLGFYTHVFMIAVAIAQSVAALLFVLAGKRRASGWGMQPRAAGHFFASLLCAGIITFLLYSPVLPAFLANLGKVEFGTSHPLPFLNSLADTLLPGITGSAGALVYGIVLTAGTVCMARKDLMVLIYVLVLVTIPLTLYLLLHPMFAFERYFIFALPFVILIISEGVLGLAEIARGGGRVAVLIGVLALLLFFQMPALGRVLTQDRQNYREAASYVAGALEKGTGDLVFSIGYAGEHFRYYAPGISLHTPQTLDELFQLMQGSERVWCLITAWLPEIRPPYGDAALYSERDGQTDIYNYVRKHFVLRKAFRSRYPVRVYSLER